VHAALIAQKHATVVALDVIAVFNIMFVEQWRISS